MNVQHERISEDKDPKFLMIPTHPIPERKNLARGSNRVARSP